MKKHRTGNIPRNLTKRESNQIGTGSSELHVIMPLRSSWRMPRKRISSPSPVVRIRLTISKVKYGRFASCQATRSGAIETSLPEKSSRT
jgi:hypothetical protein